MPPAGDPRHPIGVVAERTGLTPDVLRVWERRYAVVEPRRSSGGQRLYSDADVERLLLLHRATQGGHGISHVASLTRAKLEELVRDIESLPPASTRFEGSAQPHAAVAQLLALTDAFDPEGVEILLKRSVARYGIIRFVDEIAAPFLRGVGDAWHAGKVTASQEHLASAIVQRVVSETAPLLTGGDDNPSIVIGTLEGERHANGALMAAVTAATEGWRVVYLGADLPASEISDATVRTSSHAVGISMVLHDARRAAGLRDLRKRLPGHVALLAGGEGARVLHRSMARDDIVFVESMSELHRELADLHRKLR
jgi:MerR family transcriptional regulator, light-induced transcriptional regulator